MHYNYYRQYGFRLLTFPIYFLTGVVWSNSEPSYVRFTFDPSTTSVFLFAGIFSYKVSVNLPAGIYTCASMVFNGGIKFSIDPMHPCRL